MFGKKSILFTLSALLSVVACRHADSTVTWSRPSRGDDKPQLSKTAGEVLTETAQAIFDLPGWSFTVHVESQEWRGQENPGPSTLDADIRMAPNELTSVRIANQGEQDLVLEINPREVCWATDDNSTPQCCPRADCLVDRALPKAAQRCDIGWFQVSLLGVKESGLRRDLLDAASDAHGVTTIERDGRTLYVVSENKQYPGSDGYPPRRRNMTFEVDSVTMLPVSIDTYFYAKDAEKGWCLERTKKRRIATSGVTSLPLESFTNLRRRLDAAGVGDGRAVRLGDANGGDDGMKKQM